MNFQLDQCLQGLLGGLVIGSVLGTLLLFSGRVVGVSGILFSLFMAPKGDRSWRLLFLVGLVLGGVWFWLGNDEAMTLQFSSIPRVVLAGLLVGLGTRLANGCTSGHGVCGIGRGAKRSVVATCIFMAVAMLVVYLEGKGAP